MHSFHEKREELFVHEEQHYLPGDVFEVMVVDYWMGTHHQAENMEEQQDYCLVDTIVESLFGFCQDQGTFLQKMALEKESSKKGAKFRQLKHVVDDDEDVLGVFIDVVHDNVSKIISNRKVQFLELGEFL